MGLYGDEYFVDSISLLSEAIDNELRNFDIMMESADPTETHKIGHVHGGAIVNRILNLWDKFYTWFTKVVRDLKLSFKKSQLNRLLREASSRKNEITNGIAYQYDIIIKTDHRGEDTIDAEEYNEDIKDLINKVNKINIDDYNDNTSSDIKDLMFEMLKYVEVISTVKFSKIEDEKFCLSYSEQYDRNEIFDLANDYAKNFNNAVENHNKLSTIIDKYNIKMREARKNYKAGEYETFNKFADFSLTVKLFKNIATINFNIIGKFFKISSIYCLGLIGKSTKENID